MKYSVIVDDCAVSDVFGSDLPFNLKKEIKRYIKDNVLLLNRIEELIADEIINGVHPPKVAIITKYDKCEILKMRYTGLNNAGSSYGFRLIVLVDHINHFGILLSIYHKKDKGDLSMNEKNMLKKLCVKYYLSIMKGN